MTRINLVLPCELSDQHLIAEYRELPRVIKGSFNIINAPKTYTLGKGHILWAKCHEPYLLERYKEIINEMLYRGFSIKYSYDDLLKLYNKNIINTYKPDDNEIEISKKRIIEKINLKNNFYKWTKRQKPNWL